MPLTRTDVGLLRSLAKQIVSEVRSLHQILDVIQKHLESIRKHSDAEQQPANPQPTHPQAVIISELNLPIATTRYYESQERQEPSNIWRVLKPWIEVGGFLALVAYVIVTANTLSEIKKQVSAAESQVGIMRNQLEAADRPWVTVELQIAAPLTFNDNGDLHISFMFTLKNVGRSVATNATVYVSVFVPPWEVSQHFNQPVERQRALCDKIQPHALTLMLFPDDVKPFNASITFSRAEIEANTIPPPPGMPIPPPPGKRIAPVLFGCVDYQFSSLPKHHQTGFIYSIFRHEPANQGTLFAIVIGQELPIARIRLERWSFGGDYAN
jgi:hypothetical protein